MLIICPASAVAELNEQALHEQVIDEQEALNKDKQLFTQANELVTQGQLAQAEAIYRDMLQRHSDWPEPKNNLAILLLQTNRMEEAKQMLEQAVTSSPSYKIAQNNRTQLYNYLATQAYDKALGSGQQLAVPKMQAIEEIFQPVKIIEKEIFIEKEVKVIVEKPVYKTAVEPPQSTAVQSADLPDETKKLTEVTNHIRQKLLGWSRAWSQGNFEHYVQAYSTQFTPSDSRKSFDEWKNIRKARLKYSKGVSVNFDQLRVFLEAQSEYALVEFVQDYQSASYSDKVLKQLYMQNLQGNWLILSERTIKTY